MGLFVRNLIEFGGLALTLLILGRVLISWVDSSGRSQLAVFLYRATEPILAPVRQLLPRTGMLDLSPMIVLIVLSFLLQSVR